MSLINTEKISSFPAALEYDAIMLRIFVPIGIINGRVATVKIYCKNDTQKPECPQK